MKPSEELFELIHALNQTEKRYFKVFAAKNRDANNVYIRLFDAIDAQKTYDEKALREKFRNEPFVKQLHVAKNYLHRVVLKSLAAYHSKSSVNAQALEMLRFAEVLYEKGFYKQCEKLISKGKELCRQYEKYTLLAQFCEWEGKLLSHTSKFAEINECIRQEQDCLKIAGNVLDYKQKAFGLYDKVVKIGVVRNRAERQALDRQMRDPLLKADVASLTSEALYYRYSAFSLYASATGNYKTHFEYTKKYLTSLSGTKRFRANIPIIISAASITYATPCFSLAGMKRRSNWCAKCATSAPHVA